jgi:hypothetical protein
MFFSDLQLELPKQLQVAADDILESFASQHQIQLRFVIHILESRDQFVVC